MFFLAHFRGIVAFVVLWFGLSKFQNLTVHVSIIRCQYEEFFSGFEFNELYNSTTKKKKKTKIPFEAAQDQALSVVRCQYE